MKYFFLTLITFSFLFQRSGPDPYHLSGGGILIPSPTVDMKTDLNTDNTDPSSLLETATF